VESHPGGLLETSVDVGDRVDREIGSHTCHWECMPSSIPECWKHPSSRSEAPERDYQ